MAAPLIAAVDLARRQDGVISRRQLYRLGVTRGQVNAQLRARRWRRVGRQTVAVHTGPLQETARWAAAVLETGPRAALDGVTALCAAGVRGLEDDVVHVIVPKSSEPRRSRRVRVHESRRFREEDVVVFGVRRMRPAVAAVHAALWACSDRQAALFVVMTIQQRVAAAADVADALAGVRRHPRLRLLRRVVADAADGTESLGELDVLTALRRRGLPEPERQAVRRLSGGRARLDLEWPEWRLVLEIDGRQHDAAPARLADVLRDLEVTAGGATVLRIPLLAWRLDQDAVLDRLAAVFRSRGWTPHVAA